MQRSDGLGSSMSSVLCPPLSFNIITYNFRRNILNRFNDVRDLNPFLLTGV